MHSVSRKTAIASEVTLFKVELSIEPFYYLDPKVFHRLLAQQLLVKLTFKQFNHSGDIRHKTMQISIAVLGANLH